MSVSSGFSLGLGAARSLIAAAVLMLPAVPALALEDTGVAASGVATSGAAASTVTAADTSAPDTANTASHAALNPAPAAANTAAAAVHTMPAPGAAVTATSPLNMMLGLLFLLGLVGLAWWFVKRTGGAQWQSVRAMKVVASLPVSARERVMLIEVGGQQLLIGVAPGRVNLLHHFDEPVVTDTGSGEDFASRIRQVMQHGLNR